MASQQEVNEISAERGGLLQLEDDHEICSSSTSDENKVVGVAGAGTISASNEHLHDESSDKIKGQLKEKRYLFLKKCFEEIKSRKHIPDYYERFGVQSSLKPLELEDIPCVCYREKKCRISKKASEVKEELSRQETTSAVSDVSTESLIYPFEDHNIACNIRKLNYYFLAIAEYFTDENTHPDLFLLDSDSLVGYRKKTIRVIRKIMVLKLKWGMQGKNEDWEVCMTKEDVEKWEKRNHIREYLHFTLNNMLEALIGPDESLTEKENDYDLDFLEREGAKICPVEREYILWKKLLENMEVGYKMSQEKIKREIEEAVIEGYYSNVLAERLRIESIANEILSINRIVGRGNTIREKIIREAEKYGKPESKE